MTSEHFLFNTIAWNLSGFIIIFFEPFYSNILSDSNLFIRSAIVFAQAASVLWSARLWTEEEKKKKKGLLIEKSNRSGPTIEPCDTPVMIFSKLLYVLFIWMHNKVVIRPIRCLVRPAADDDFVTCRKARVNRCLC